ncbi:flagellar attachment zone protein 1-like isoform X2 [Hyposmocoma kahamanoa]|uniref:flagellar attachment zone protein 1-like isoform X2 n=1 Tax=Hyposmocoma kahamanoa TaxID=1477025 RepID=UPI000E6D7726|nr:flagellar attachment zone protein 1-like isoform X2 [Hyposmocoma kahamanoa]
MYKGSHISDKDDGISKKRHLTRQTIINKRAQSASPVPCTPKSAPAVNGGKDVRGRRCQSLSPSFAKKSVDWFTPIEAGAAAVTAENHNCKIVQEQEKDLILPQCLVLKMTRTLSTKKREFIKMRKTIITQQNNLLELYASVRDLEARSGAPVDESLGEVRILSITGWPAHDLLLLVRDDLEVLRNPEISGVFGPQVVQQLHAQLNPIPEEVLSLGAELMARYIDLLNFLRGKLRTDRNSYSTNLEWKTKNNELDQETEKLHRKITAIAQNLKAKICYSLELSKIPWLDRESLAKKMERLQKENMMLQHKIDEYNKNEYPDCKDNNPSQDVSLANYQALSDELAKERAAREALKDVVSAAESMLRVARARISILERHLKENKSELEAARRKHKDLEQLYRHRETSYDARSKKLLEVSKTGEMTIEQLSRQRDALELRVKELHEIAMKAERAAEVREMEQKARAENFQAKVAEQERKRDAAELKVAEMENKVKELEDTLHSLRERSGRLVDMERRRCLEYVPSKENEPSDRETEIWKELQATRLILSRAEEELKQSRADKDSFLNTLSRIAQEGQENVQDKMATELLDKEQKIAKLQRIIDELRENEKLMENSMTQYENQLASLRLEVKRLRNYDCYAKEVPYLEIETELLEMHMQVESLTRERSALVTAAASRALMLERHERAADLFARVTRARRDLAALLESRSDPQHIADVHQAEMSRSLSSVCATAAETWTALRAERARVLRLESAVLAQSLQLEREGRVRTQLERRRALLEREVLRTHHSCTSSQQHSPMMRNALIQDIFCYR